MLRNVPVLPVLLVPVLLFLLLSLPSTVSAAEPFGSGSGVALSQSQALSQPQSPFRPQAIPPGLTPEQADAARELVGSDPEAKKALEEILRKRAEEAEADAATRELAPGKPDAGTAARAGRAVGEPRHDWTKSPYVGGLFGGRLTAAERETVVHFGHDLSAAPDGPAAALENMPVAPGYVVGPGDEIVVRMWGRVEGTQRMVVDRDGKIFFPKLGTLSVAGMTFEQVKALLKEKVSTIAEVSSDVGLGRMKGIRVSVTGEVRFPGWYNISSLHTALQVLAAAGQVKDIGSLRRIRIVRGGKTAEEIDLYDFLLKGDARSDIRLLQGDVVFVPVVGKLAAVVGEVRRPAIYEMKEEKSLLELVKLAGGFTPAAYKRRVQVERLEGNVARVVLDADADALEKSGGGLEIADGDLVRVFPIVLADGNAVTLEGNVRRPGRYELKRGMTVGSLLKDEREFLPETFFDYALIVRRMPPDLRKEVVPVNLREIVLERKPGADVALAPRDTLRVFRRSDFKDAPKASISGEVRLTRKGLLQTLGLDNQVRQMLRADEDWRKQPVETDSGGEGALRGDGIPGSGAGQAVLPGNDADGAAHRERELREAALRERELRDADRRGTETRSGDARTGDARDMGARDGGARDTSIREREIRKAETVGVDPRESMPRAFDRRDPDAPVATSPYEKEALTFEIHGGTRVADLVKMAGGLTRLAWLERAEILRVDDERNYRTIYFHLGRAIAGDPEENKLLENEDQVRIHSVNEKAYRKAAAVSGEVNRPGDFVLTEGMKLSDLLFKAG
ncbi:MAG: SLBB domain-containing protein, partial [Thermodesulfobacteriota bacterium]